MAEHGAGSVLDLGSCLVSRNVNLLVLRGEARLDDLAKISRADVFDQVLNKPGIQRELTRKHAEGFMEYARWGQDADPITEPKFVPDVLLNMRDKSVAEFYEPQDPAVAIEFSSFPDDDLAPPTFVGVRIKLSKITTPTKPGDPVQISRVDGNHRLSGTDAELRLLGEDSSTLDGLPTIPFSMTVGLSALHELMLFKALNGNHKGMDVAMIDRIIAEISPDLSLSSDPKERALWLSEQLAENGLPFAGMVNWGGSKKGLKELGEKRPIKISTLKNAHIKLLDRAESVGMALMDSPTKQLKLIALYWAAVKKAFPEPWSNERDFILLSLIGLEGFAMYGGLLIRDAPSKVSAVDEIDTYFSARLETIAKNVSLAKKDWVGTAGGGGSKKVLDTLLANAKEDDVELTQFVSDLDAPESLEEKLNPPARAPEEQPE